MHRAIIAAFLLFILWLLLSGHVKPFIISLGVASCIFVAWVAFKFSLLSPDSSTLRFNLNLPRFLPWFFIQLAKSNIDVTRRILDPKLPIEPSFNSIPLSQHTNIAKVVYANCITLTPGTYSLSIDDQTIEVHCLSKESAEELFKGEMSNRISSLESKLHTSRTTE